MSDLLHKRIMSMQSWKDLKELTKNIAAKGNETDETRQSVKDRSLELATYDVLKAVEKDYGDLSEVERSLVNAAAKYAAIMKDDEKRANRTFPQIRRVGLIGAAEASVKKPHTQGSLTLSIDEESGVSYEQTVVDFPNAFTSIAVWHARNKLGLPNPTKNPPAEADIETNVYTTAYLNWLADRSHDNGGYLPTFTNASAAAEIGHVGLSAQGRSYGNLQSRIDYACFLCDLPPLGCGAQQTFEDAWGQEGRAWSFNVPFLQAATQNKIWIRDDFDRIQSMIDTLPGRAYVLWQESMQARENEVRSWAKRWEDVGSSHITNDQFRSDRFPAAKLELATEEFIWLSLQLFVSGEARHGFGESTDYDLIYESKRFPPKAVFGVALSLALNNEPVEPRNFSGGQDSVCFRLLRNAGYMIIPKGEIIPVELDEDINESEWIEGSKVLRSHFVKERKRGASKAKKAQNRREFGTLTCEICKCKPVEEYGTELAESCIEVHHANVQVNEMADNHKTRLKDLMCLCANCHRLEHKKLRSELVTDSA